jgi:hypothetical protein
MINRLPQEFRLPAANETHKARPLERTPTWMRRGIVCGGRCIAKRPIAALSVAFISGAVMGRLVKR